MRNADNLLNRQKRKSKEGVGDASAEISEAEEGMISKNSLRKFDMKKYCMLKMYW